MGGKKKEGGREKRWGGGNKEAAYYVLAPPTGKEMSSAGFLTPYQNCILVLNRMLALDYTALK